MERLYELWCRIAEGVIIISSVNSMLLCFVLAGQRQDFSWYLLAAAIIALLVVWVQANHDGDPSWPGKDGDDQP